MTPARVDPFSFCCFPLILGRKSPLVSSAPSLKKNVDSLYRRSNVNVIFISSNGEGGRASIFCCRLNKRVRNSLQFRNFILRHSYASRSVTDSDGVTNADYGSFR